MAKILGLRKYSFNLFNRKEPREKRRKEPKGIFKEINICNFSLLCIFAIENFISNRIISALSAKKLSVLCG